MPALVINVVILAVFEAMASVLLVMLAVFDETLFVNTSSAPSALDFSSCIAAVFAVMLAVFVAIALVLLVILAVFEAIASVLLVILAVFVAIALVLLVMLAVLASMALVLLVILAVFDAIALVLLVMLAVLDAILVSNPLIVLELTPPILFTVVLNVPEPLPVTSPVNVIV